MAAIVKSAVIIVALLTIFVLCVASFHASNFQAANGFSPYGAKGVMSAVSSSGIIFALLGFEQADQLAGESKNPKRDIPRAVIGSVVIGVLIYDFFIGDILHGRLKMAEDVSGPIPESEPVATTMADSSAAEVPEARIPRSSETNVAADPTIQTQTPRDPRAGS